MATPQTPPPARTLRVAYVVQGYPKISHAFIQREVGALRRAGVAIETYALQRSMDAEIVTDVDRQEASTTTYLRPASLLSVGFAHLATLVRQPRAYASTAWFSWRHGPPGVIGRLRQVAYFGQAVLLWRLLRKTQVDHVHAHHANVACDVAWLATVLQGRVGPRWTWSFTMHGPTEFAEVTRYNLARKATTADLVVCISDFCRSQLLALIDPSGSDRLVVVHCSADTSWYTAPAVDDDQRDGLRLLSIGRLVPEKAFAVLLDAVAQCRDSGIDLEATIVGDGPDRRRLEAHATNLGIASQVRFRGALGQDEVRAALREADVFCLPSFAEGVPVVLMEAMACALPVVATRITGIPELIEDGVSGWLVTPGRPDLLAAALRSIAVDRVEAQAIADAGRTAVLAAFDADANAQLLAQAFRRCASQRGLP